MKVKIQHVACVVLLGLVVGCGSGGGGGEKDPPGAPTLNLAFAPKELRFSWLAVSDTDFYRLFENPDGVSGFSQIGGNLTGLSFNHPISVHRRVNASYRLDACNGAGCTSSAVVALGANLTQAIGFVKPLNTTAGAEFGISVALSTDGNTLAVGAWEHPVGPSGVGFSAVGAAYVFSRSASGWSEQAFLMPNHVHAEERFGFAVSLSADGNTLVVGAPGEASSSATTPNITAPDAGAVYVFTRAAGAWSFPTYIKPSNPGAGDRFGTAVALSGDGRTLAVGAPNEDSSSAVTPDEAAANAGAVYVFTGSGGVWSQQAYLKGSNTGAGDEFGRSVALSTNGNTLAIGANLEDSSTSAVPDELASDSGAVYVFNRSGTAWSQQAYLKASNVAANDQFGAGVTLSGDGNTLAAGAPGEDSSTTTVNSTPNELAGSAGAAYVFTRTGTLWSQQAYVKASNAGAGDMFGAGVALSADGNTLAVGAWGEASNTTGVNSTPNNAAGFGTGAAYVFIRNANVWVQQAYVKASNTGAADTFGERGVALSGDGSTLAVGAEGESSSGFGIGSTPNEAAGHSGAVYLY